MKIEQHKSLLHNTCSNIHPIWRMVAVKTRISFRVPQGNQHCHAIFKLHIDSWLSKERTTPPNLTV